jgi:hypothetical protein
MNTCYAVASMLQAMGVGSWAFDRMDWMVVLGASGDPKVPGFGFRYDTNERWSVPNISGLLGVFERTVLPLSQYEKAKNVLKNSSIYLK